MRWTLLGVGLLVAALTGAFPALANAQVPIAATVTRVIDGDTVQATPAGGQEITVRLIGIDTPETKRPGVPVECGGPEATDALRDLVEGQTVTLTPDPTQDAVDRYGRSLFYVDRGDGLDVGLEMIRRGWAMAYVYEVEFQRFPEYERAEDDSARGVWAACEGDFHLDLAEQRRDSAKAFVELYYRRISNHQFLSAWRMLGTRRKAQVRPYRQWKAGFRGSLGVSVLAATARLAGPGRAVISVRLRSRDRDVCSRRIMRQYFRGKVVVAPHGDSWLVVKFQIRKTRGKTPRLSMAQCPAPEPPSQPETPPAPPADCQGYDPCITPGPDVDCAGGSGDGPRYRDGPIYVTGSDPYGLDSDGDGVACES